MDELERRMREQWKVSAVSTTVVEKHQLLQWLQTLILLRGLLTTVANTENKEWMKRILEAAVETEKQIVAVSSR